ncbi:hypothetical protein [Rhodoflexus sp.]
MNQRFKVGIVVLALAATIFSCGGSKSEGKMEEGEKVGITNALDKIQDMANAVEQSQKNAEQKLQERIRRGDTLAIPYAELARFIPDAIDDFKSETSELRGETTTTAGMSVSTVRKKLVNGDSYISFELTDYNSGANAAAQGALAMFSMAAEISMENNEMKQVGFKQGSEIKGSITLQKNRQIAELAAVIAGRFLVKVEANNQTDIEGIKDYFQRLSLNELSAR